MKRLCTLLFVFLSILSFSQPFQETILTSNFTDPYTLKSADLDSNSFEDIIACGKEGIAWFKNIDGTNFEKIIIHDSMYVIDIEVINFDLDTDLDIVGINSLSQSMFWLENDGSMNFTYHLITDTLSDLREIRVVDVDNDGDVDIFVSIYSGGFQNIYLYENIGTGFTSTYIDRVDFSRDIYVFDYDNDNDMDFLSKTNYSPFTTEELVIMVNNGSNVFTEVQIYEKTGSIDITDAQFVDLDKNGICDLIIADNVQDELYWLENCTIRHNILTSESVRDVLAEDFNGDNIMDIVYKYESSTYDLHVLKGSNPGSSMSFTEVFYYDLEVSSEELISIDVNADGLPEFAYSTAIRDEVAYMNNDSSFVFTLVKLSSSVPQPESMVRIDLDQDGDMDIVSIASNEEMIWLEQQPGGAYKQNFITSALDNPIQIDVNDIDEDGHLDIITASIGDSDFSVWYNDGNQNFTEFQITSYSWQLSNPSYFSICDLDNDSDKDFVIIASSTSSYNPKGIFWIRNDSGAFSAPIAIEDGLNMMGEVVTHDLNNDGSIDIIVADGEYGSAGLRVIQNNNGATSFTITTLASRAVSVRLGDIDSDGLMDFVTRNDIDNDIVWFKNNGNMTFTGDTIFMNESRDVRFEVCDDGNDGNTDIFFYDFYYGYTNGAGFNAGILTNDGNEVFTQTYYIENTYNMLSAIPVDVDNDTDIDFFMGFDISDKISFFENKRISLIAPTVISWPIASDITYEDSLGNSILTGGSGSVPGIFSFSNPAYLPDAGVYAALVTFYPDNDSTYSSVTGTVNVVVHKADPTVFIWPEAGDLEYGYPLGASVLGGDSTSTPGTFTFDNPSATPSLGIYVAAVTFTPDDSSNYNTVSGNVNVNVIRADPSILSWPAAADIDCGDSLGNSLLTGGTASVTGTFAFDNPLVFPSGGIYTANVTFAPDDTVHYNSIGGTVDVAVNMLDTTNVLDEFCDGSLYNFYGVNLTDSGIYYHTLTSVISGCDSVIQLDLSMNLITTTVTTDEFCEGSIYDFYGTNLTDSGTYYHTLTSVISGCDSIIQIDLTMNLIDTSIINDAFCQDSIYNFFGTNLTASGTYFHTQISAVTGCDSVIQLELVENPNYYIQETEFICDGDSYTWPVNGLSYSAAGIYIEAYFAAANGCDSIHELELMVNPAFYVVATDSICDGDSIQWRGSWYGTAGIYMDPFTSVNGCDSTYTLDLTVNPLPQVFAVTGGGSYPSGGAGLPVGLSNSETGVDYTLILDGTGIISTENGTGTAIDFGNQILAGNYFVIAESMTTHCEVEMLGSVTITIITSTNEITKNRFSVYPNPTNGKIAIEGKNIRTVSISDLTGKIILEKIVNHDFIEIDLIGYAKAVYFAKIMTDDGVAVQKIIVK